MKIKQTKEVELSAVTMEGASDVCMRQLVTEADGAPNFAMRQFIVDPGGHTPRHHHPYEHEIYVLEGSGTVLEGETERPIAAGDVVFVEPDEIHQFRNTGGGPMTFLCLIPNSAKSQPVLHVPEPVVSGCDG